MYDAISRDMCVLKCLQAGVGKFGFISPRVHASTHEPGNNTRSLQPPTNQISTVMWQDLQFSQSLGAWWPLRLPPSSTHTKRSHKRTETLVYRDLISCHPGRYVSDHKQAGVEKFMLITGLFTFVT